VNLAMLIFHALPHCWHIVNGPLHAVARHHHHHRVCGGGGSCTPPAGTPGGPPLGPR
jgi:hypothetical protein